MELMIVGAMKMNPIKLVQLEHAKWTSFLVEMGAAFPEHGCVTGKMTVVTRRMKWHHVNSQLVNHSLNLYAKVEGALAANGTATLMTTVGTGVMRLAVFTLALIISSDVPVADVFQATGPVMVTMTVETSVMKPKSIVPKKRLILLSVVMEMNFNATLMEIVYLICGAVMGKKIVKMVVMKKAAMVPYDCVITKQSFPVGV